MASTVTAMPSTPMSEAERQTRLDLAACPAVRRQGRSAHTPSRQMIGETPEWAWWVMVGLLAFVMLLPIIKR